ncbi:hypothetical protein AMAG_20674 [Allomyces macrogynus ATCC 38327]|uniref:Uncharacterized protein n=1 Tax=Allomyces macrogynus (strain ATCC 38327) TaxID=578462 RepID=A0A0L0TEJ0_ALLM3|nr:hypothetical protein AMAG_20674 [Allomyces macrogynus ATCC 38327]|eukprot:KNE73110.1 hypothetical protein AMAG_20674 [Allomyces macrogynus ATCC 38327]
MPSRGKSIVPGPAMAGVVSAAQQQVAAVAGSSAASMPAINMDSKVVQGDGRTRPTTCPASDEAITVVDAAGTDGLLPSSVAERGRSRSRSASTVFAGMMTQEAL